MNTKEFLVLNFKTETVVQGNNFQKRALNRDV